MSNYSTESKFTLKTAVLSFQHMFAMFGATITVPILCNMSISVALLAAGIGTLLFYFLTNKKVPVFLGSSFAFIPGLATIMSGAGAIGSDTWNVAMGKASIAVMIAGLVYVVLAFLIKKIGVEKIKKAFPPVVVGPIIILIGIILIPKTFYNNILMPIQWNGIAAWKQWSTAIVTLATILLTNAFAKKNSFLKVVPILLSFAVGYVYALCIGIVDFSHCDWTKIVIFQDLKTTFGFYGSMSFDWTAILAIAPIALVTFMEHIGDINANSNICNKNFMVDPGLHRTVLGDGVATIAAGAIGGPPNTTYGENTAVLAITKNYNTKNIFYAALMAIFLGCFTIFGTAISTIPAAVIGGASMVLYGMIAASGLRTLVESKVDFSNTKNLLIVSTVLAIGLGFSTMSIIGDAAGALGGALPGTFFKLMIGNVEISPLALATVVGLVLNALIPDEKKDEETK